MSDLDEEITKLCGEIESCTNNRTKLKILVEELCTLSQHSLLDIQYELRLTEVIIYVLRVTLQTLLLPQNDLYEESEPGPNQFIDYIECTEYNFPLITKLYIDALSNDRLKFSLPQIKSIVILGLHICGSHSQIYPWNNNRIVLSGHATTLNTCGCTTVQQLMEGGKDFKFKDGLAKDLFSYLMPFLKINEWKKNPPIKFVFSWSLKNIKHPNLIDYLPEVLAPSLLFVDDFVTQNKVLGVLCLSHIINNVNPSDLRMYGRADVIFDALYHLIYTKEVELIEILYPCLLEILPTVNEDPNKPSKDLKRDKYDKVFSQLLSAMECEQQLKFRTAYITQLEPFISKMEINVVRHMRDLLRVLYGYLQALDEDCTKKNSLLALKMLIKVAWPRIPFHMEDILKNLLRFAYDIQIAQKIENSELLDLVVECLELIRKTSEERFEMLCKPLYDIEIKPIKTVLEKCSHSNCTSE